MRAFILLVFMWASAPSYAQVQGPAPERSIFAISDVEVDISAASAASARQQAIAQARRLAFGRLFEKLVAEEDWSALPALSNRELMEMVGAIDVIDEKTTTTRYFATLSVIFQREPVLTLMRSLGVTFTDSPTPPMVLLPIARYAGTDMLWSGDNVWAAAWRQSPTRAASLVDYVIPEGGPQDAVMMSARAAAALPPKEYLQLLRHYEASDVLSAHAEIMVDPDTGAFALGVEALRGPQRADFMAFTLVQQEGESPPGLLERAIVQIDRQLSALWKRQLLVEYSQARDITLQAKFDSAQDWQTISRAISQNRRLRSVKMESLNLSSATLYAQQFGDVEPLKASLKEKGLNFDPLGPDSWQITAMSAAEVEALRLNNLDAAVSGYVDPLADAQTVEEEALQDAPMRAPWEIEDIPADDVAGELDDIDAPSMLQNEDSAP